VQLAIEHNLAGVQQYNEGMLEQAMKEFERALNELEAMKVSISSYNQELYSRLKNVYSGNKTRMLEKTEKIDAYFSLANECNAVGVKYYNEGSFDKAKLEFENAIKQLTEVKLLVPKYSGNGYAGLLQIYEENLSRAEAER
jgi:tetratricopeptide (TPR) repeat protein